MSKAYQETYAKYNAALAKSKTGDKQAKADKAAIMGELRQMERESARAGVVLNPVVKRGELTVKTEDAPSRRSLQEEYVRKFSETTPVEFTDADGEPYRGTLRKFHEQRLLKR